MPVDSLQKQERRPERPFALRRSAADSRLRALRSVQALAVLQARDVGFGEPDGEMNCLVVVAPPNDLAAPIQPGQCPAVGQRDVQPNHSVRALEPAIEKLEQRIAPLSRRRRQGNTMRIAQPQVFETVARRRFEQIDLVHHLDQPVFEGLAQAEIAKHVQHVYALCLAVRMIGIADMDDDIGFGNLFQRRTKSRDEMGRKLRDETDRVRQDDLPPGRQFQTPHRRVESREQHVAGRHRRSRQTVEQRGFSGIGIADQRDHGIRYAAARFAVQSTRAPRRFEFALQTRDALADQTAVDFELALAGAAEKPEAAALALKVGP